MQDKIESGEYQEQPAIESTQEVHMSTEQPAKKWYVYLLCDPDTERPFYVGKGTGNRIDQHEQDLDNNFLGNPTKKWVIRNILAQGKQVLKKKVAEFDSEREAYMHERELISFYGPQITNIMPGSDVLQEHTEKLETKWRIIQNLIPLEQEIITFQGKPLAIVRLPNGNTCAILRWMCENLGISTKGQIERIKRSEVIARDLAYVCVQTDGGPQVMPILALRSIPYWLATIDTRRMNKEDKRRQEILEYQRGAINALYEAFKLPHQR